MKKVVVTVGPIPAQLDAVKFLTNRFKGGLALKTVRFLKEKGHQVTVVAWTYTELQDMEGVEVVRVKDVKDYVEKVLACSADAYVLAAAVANLMPSNPYEGKFPSHQYKVGEKFNIEFEIAPRLIDQIKEKYPQSTLVGYKLMDGTDDVLIKAAQVTLKESKANVVFANHPGTAKTKKWVLTQDGACFSVNFDEHLELMHRLIEEQFYKTEVIEPPEGINDLTEKDRWLLSHYPIHQEGDRYYGSFAIKKEKGFITSARGKKKAESWVWVQEVDHHQGCVKASGKATLNAPLLDAFFKKNPSFQWILHGHQSIQGISPHEHYEFPGTKGDSVHAIETESGQVITLKHHGYLVGFSQWEEVVEFLKNLDVAS